MDLRMRFSQIYCYKTNSIYLNMFLCSLCSNKFDRTIKVLIDLHCFYNVTLCNNWQFAVVNFRLCVVSFSQCTSSTCLCRWIASFRVSMSCPCHEPNQYSIKSKRSENPNNLRNTVKLRSKSAPSSMLKLRGPMGQWRVNNSYTTDRRDHWVLRRSLRMISAGQQ